MMNSKSSRTVVYVLAAIGLLFEQRLHFAELPQASHAQFAAIGQHEGQGLQLGLFGDQVLDRQRVAECDLHLVGGLELELQRCFARERQRASPSNSLKLPMRFVFDSRAAFHDSGSLMLMRTQSTSKAGATPSRYAVRHSVPTQRPAAAASHRPQTLVA